MSAGHHAHAPSGRGIWEELKSNCDAHAQLDMPEAVCSFCHVLHLTLLLLLLHNLDSQSVNRRWGVRWGSANTATHIIASIC